MLFVALIQLLLCYLHRPRLILVEELTRQPLLPLLNWLTQFRFFASRQRFHQFRNRIAKHAADPEKPERVATTAWHRLARKLLQQRYGIDLSDLEEEWEPLFWSIGTPTDVEWRGPLLMIASEASGWCGLAATLLAPELGNRYYLALWSALHFCSASTTTTGSPSAEHTQRPSPTANPRSTPRVRKRPRSKACNARPDRPRPERRPLGSAG